MIGNGKEREKKNADHFLGERIDAGEVALRDNDMLKLVDLAMEEFSLRSQKTLKRVDGSPNLEL